MIYLMSYHKTAFGVLIVCNTTRTKYGGYQIKNDIW